MNFYQLFFLGWEDCRGRLGEKVITGANAFGLWQRRYALTRMARDEYASVEQYSITAKQAFKNNFKSIFKYEATNNR